MGLTYEDCEETLHKCLITVSPPSLLTDGRGKRVEKVEEFGWRSGEEMERIM